LWTRRAQFEERVGLRSCGERHQTEECTCDETEVVRTYRHVVLLDWEGEAPGVNGGEQAAGPSQ